MYTQQQHQSLSIHQQKSTIQKLLDDNSQLITLILDLQSKGKHSESFECQRTLYRNLVYLAQSDPSQSHHLNELSPPDIFIQSQHSFANENVAQQVQSEQIYRPQSNNSTVFNTQNQAFHQSNNGGLYSLLTSTNSSVEQQLPPNSTSKPTTFQKRLPYPQQGRVPNSELIDPSYSHSFTPSQQHSYPMQHGDYMQQHPSYHQQRNAASQSSASINTQNYAPNQPVMHNNYNEQQQQQMYFPTQNYHTPQQQWQGQSRMSVQQQQQQQQYAQSYPQQQVLPQNMSKIFLVNPQTGSNYPGDEQTVTNLLRENAALIRTIKELQNEGNNDHLFDYMKQLHRNIVWLSLLADGTSSKTNN